jgi:hypothetical protein
MSNLDWALHYARNGVPVFPLHEIFWLPDGTPCCTCSGKPECTGERKAIGKHPRWIKGLFEHGHNSATTDEARIRAAWGMFPNAGIGRGTAGEIVLDLDGPAGMEALARFQAEDGPYPETLRARSGRLAGGEHVFYKTPNIPGAELISTKSPAPGMDIRANGRSFVVQAPSLHKSGRRYEWINPGTPIADAPPALVARLVALLTPSTSNGEPYQRPVDAGAFRPGSVLSSMARLSPRTGRATLDFEAALAAIDPLSTRSMKGRESIDRALWRDMVWSMRAHERDWRDGYALERCMEWSRQFASWDEAAFFKQYWDFYRVGGPELGKQRLYDLADQLAPGWRERAWAAQGVGVQASAPSTPGIGQAEASRPPIGEGASAGALPFASSSSTTRTGPEFASAHGRKIQHNPGVFLPWPDISKDHKPAIGSMRNFWTMCNSLKIYFAYDEFLGKVICDAQGDKRVLTDPILQDIHGVAHELGFFCSVQHVRSSAHAIAQKYRFNSAKDKLDSLPPWDKCVRGERIFIDYFGCPDDAFHRSCGRFFLASLIRRIKRPGYKCDSIVVLCGPEAYGKSGFGRALVGDDQFTDSVDFSMQAKQIIENTSGAWLVEISEMANLTERSVEHVKKLLSTQFDTDRLAYGMEATRKGRGFVFLGTTNSDKPLVSRTGNRRFYVLHCQKPCDADQVRAVAAQLLAEALVIESEYGDRLELPREHMGEAKARQDAAIATDGVFDAIVTAFQDCEAGQVRISDVHKFLGVFGEAQAKSNKLGQTLQAAFAKLGWTYKCAHGIRGYQLVKDGKAPWFEYNVASENFSRRTPGKPDPEGGGAG